jgi:tellurite resistance protein TehA-like permease
LRYEVSWWSIVFPLGMYAVASEALGNAVDLPIVAAVGRHEIWLALTTWTVAFGAMLVHLGRTLGARPGHAATG